MITRRNPTYDTSLTEQEATGGKVILTGVRFSLYNLDDGGEIVAAEIHVSDPNATAETSMNEVRAELSHRLAHLANQLKDDSE